MISKSDLEKLSNEDLERLKILIDKELILRSNNKLIIKLSYNMYKGSGKCWIAMVDKDTKKILGFLNNVSTEKEGYKGVKTYEIIDGYYLFCEEGTKTTDKKEYVMIKEGKIDKF